MKLPFGMQQKDYTMSDENENDAIETEETPALETPATPPLAAAPPLTEEEWEEIEMKINGKVVKEKVNFKDKARMTKALQMERAAGEAFQGQAAARKQQEEMQANLAEFIQELRSNPLGVLQNEELGVDIRQMVEAYLQNEIDRSQKSPEQIQLEEAHAQLAALQEEKKAIEGEREAAKRQRFEQEAAVQLEAEISDAIDKGELPKSKYISQKLVDLAHIAYSNGIDLSIAELAPLVRKQYLEDMKDMLGISSDEVVESLLGKDRVKTMRNKQIQAVKNPAGTPKNPLATQDTAANGNKKEESPRVRAKDFFKGLSG